MDDDDDDDALFFLVSLTTTTSTTRGGGKLKLNKSPSDAYRSVVVTSRLFLSFHSFNQSFIHSFIHLDMKLKNFKKKFDF